MTTQAHLPRQAAPNDDEPARQAAIERYLRTGKYETTSPAWPGNAWEREVRAHDDMIRALVAEVNKLAAGHEIPSASLPADLVAFTRKKVEPMARGLFRRDEQEAVLAVLEKSVVFLTPANIDQVLLQCSWLHTAWSLANLYLDSMGASLLGPDADKIVGLSEETTCFVSLKYFKMEDPFADFVVHEAAHIFHNCKRRTIGLAEKRKREWLLDIEYQKRETFAYACEAYARILERAPKPQDRPALATEYASKVRVSGERVDTVEVNSILADACAARNGWKIILARCAPEKSKTISTLSQI
ncbi:MAG: hypothetical protein ABSF35_25245 [Polyangia bacterium]|jgi:hypothetical protein